MKLSPGLLIAISALLSLPARGAAAQARALPENAKSLEDVIYEGQPVSPESDAWKSAVALEFDIPEGGAAACTGVFLDTDMILTAAHCGIKNGGKLTINLFRKNRAAAEKINLQGDEFTFAEHPLYRETAGSNPGTDDVAVIALRSARLPEGFHAAEIQKAGQAAAAKPGQSVFVAGAGRNEKHKMSDRLYVAQGQITGYEAGSVMRVVFRNHQGICMGDSGSPVFVTSEGKIFLTGLVTAVHTDLSDICGSLLYVNVIGADRYEWALSQTRLLRAGFLKSK